MRFQALCLSATIALVAACARGNADLDGTPKIGETCQLRSCECVSGTIPLLFKRERTPILWRENGDAYCPYGFNLVTTD